MSRSRSCPRAEADERRVEEVITFDDPAGTTLEVFHGAVLDHSPVITPFGARFVTGDQGLGHVVVPAMDANGLFDFYTGVLGFRSRGAFRVPAPPEFGPIRVRFLGINERHHSLAICPAMNQDKPGSSTSWWRSTASTPSGRRWTASTRKASSSPRRWAATPTTRWCPFTSGRPGDWDIEFGTEGMRVDERYYTAEEITADSYWGHQWMGEPPAAMRM